MPLLDSVALHMHLAIEKDVPPAVGRQRNVARIALRILVKFDSTTTARNLDPKIRKTMFGSKNI